MQRRTILLGAANVSAGASMPRLACANVPKPYSWDIAPPMNSREAYIGWMVANRGEDPRFLGQHWGRYEALLRNKDVLDDRNKRAFLLLPREEFVLKQNLGRTYDHAFLDIGYGVTISGPHVVSRMTTTIDAQFGDKVLEDRHRLGLSVGLSRQSHRQGLDHRDHQAAGGAHARHLRRADRARLYRVQ